MARLPRLQRDTVITAKGDLPSPTLMRYLQRLIEAIESEFGAIEAAAAAQAAAEAADEAAALAAAAAGDAQTAADAAQTTAEAAQAAVDAIVVPPTGSRTVSTNDSIFSDDYAILADASGGAITLSLYAAAAAINSSVVVTKTDGTANAVNVTNRRG